MLRKSRVSSQVVFILLLSACSGFAETDYGLQTPMNQVQTEPTSRATSLLEFPYSASLTPIVSTFEPIAINSLLPSETVKSIASTLIPTQTLPAPIVNTATPTVIPPTPTRTPQLVTTIPIARIQILRPGPASQVTSPFQVKASLIPGPRGIVRVELLGEDGRVLRQEVLSYQSQDNARLQISTQIEFELAGVAELGRVQISTDDGAGRLMAVASIDVILLSMGEPDLNPPGDGLANLVIAHPKPNALIQGGILQVSGLARPRTAKPLVVELWTTDKRLVGSQQVSVIFSQTNSHGTFVIDVPYQVDKPTRVRLLVWEPGERIPGIAYLSSLEVLLSP